MGVDLVPRVAAGSLEELLDGGVVVGPLDASDAKSGSALERVERDGERLILKHLHVDGDWTMRGFGDLCCRPVEMWTSGLLDAVPDVIDHAIVGAAAGLGRNGWGGALLLRDVGAHLIPAGDERVDHDVHRQLLDHIAALSVAFWDTEELPEHVPLENRYSAFNPAWLAAEEARGWPDAVPPIAARGWRAFAERAPGDVLDLVTDLRHDVDPLVVALRRTPLAFIHGDWKMGNLGAHDGRTVLLDWTYPGVGPVCHDLGWYLAINRARLPEPKDDAIEAARRNLEARGIDTRSWWDAQLSLCLLGTLVQFGWEKALDDDDELAWWCERARDGARWLA